MVAISRCKVRSLACPQMRWSISTTGAMRALPKARHSAHRELTVRRGQRQFVGFGAVAVIVSSIPDRGGTLKQVARAAGMARRTAANADGVLALGLRLKSA